MRRGEIANCVYDIYYFRLGVFFIPSLFMMCVLLVLRGVFDIIEASFTHLYNRLFRGGGKAVAYHLSVFVSLQLLLQFMTFVSLLGMSCILHMFIGIHSID